MKAFHNAREAKEFLVARIVAAAQRESVPLSEIERNMLYFSESGWTLPGIVSVHEQFDREYDQDKYEKTIAPLVRKADKHARKESRDEYDRWWDAIRFLKKEDHYILVMIGIAGLRPAGDRLRLLGAGLGIVICILLAEFLAIRHQSGLSRYLPSRDALTFSIWGITVCAVIIFSLFRLIAGRKKSGGNGTH